jgi:hypothetical protein
MMGDPFATSAFLDSSCFSILYPLYHHNSDFMFRNQPQAPYPNQQYLAPPPKWDPHLRIGPTDQGKILSHAVGINPTLLAAAKDKKRGRATQVTGPGGLKVPSINSSFISRIYSAQIPNQAFPAYQLPAALTRELQHHIDIADDYFINHLFPEKSLPLGMSDEAIFQALSISDNRKTSICNGEGHLLQTPSALKEEELANWLNSIGTTVGNAFNKKPLRFWSHFSCDTPSIGASSTVQRKPDLVLLDEKHYGGLNGNFKQIDWAFIRAFAEVTSQSSISQRMIDSINSKSYLMFLCQYDRRFVVAISFTSSVDESFRLTVTDREGQIRWTVDLNSRSEERAKLFFRILVMLMFGRPLDIGLDPNIEIDDNGKCAAITFEEKRFEVEALIYSLDSIVGRGTRVWKVKNGGARYTLKDCWIQSERVGSEILMLKKIGKDKEIATSGCVPSLYCGGEVQIEDITDTTGKYRTGMPKWSKSGQRVHRRLVCSPIGGELTGYRSKQEFIKAISTIICSTSLCSQRVW